MDYLPRGPLYTEDASQEPDLEQDYHRRMGIWMEGAIEESQRTARLNSEINSVQQYIQYIQGNYHRADRPRYKSRFFQNKIGKSRFDTLSMLTDTRPVIDVTAQPGTGYDDIAKIIHLAIHDSWARSDADLSLVTTGDISMAWGTAFWKIGAARPGVMKLLPCGPDQVMLIQPGFHIQESTGVRYLAWKPLSWAINKYGMRARGLERECVSGMEALADTNRYVRPGHIPELTWNGMNPGLKRLIAQQNASPEMSMGGTGLFRNLEWQEFYVDDPSINESTHRVVVRDQYLSPSEHDWWYTVAPGERLYPYKRLLAFAGKRLMYDGPNPFWHGQYPFAMLRLNPVFYSVWGLSKYRDLIPMNLAINEIVAGTLDMVKRALNPTAISRASSVPLPAWKNFLQDAPGQKLRLEGLNANPQADIRYMEPPQLPAYVFQMLAQFLIPEYEKQAGNLDVAALGKKAQVPGGDVLEQMRDAMQTSRKLEGRYIETFLRDTGVQAMSNVIQFYTRSQRMKLFGKNGVADSDFDFNPDKLWPSSYEGSNNETKREFWKNFALIVAPGSLHSGARDREKQIAIGLASRGLIPLEYLYQVLEIPQAQKWLDALKQQNQDGIALAGGRNPRLGREQRNGQV